eukprot:TRINITY_DN24801_c0_g1_i3.p1 TRINITY_DN24801_c0_g1~~TRINITY_DN24801_c0_g1_i3.p1  ORF type:complete len:533 (-),score=85.58 TRINITY_DN24801_c0_g1_i3:1035-2633(-)
MAADMLMARDARGSCQEICNHRLSTAAPADSVCRRCLRQRLSCVGAGIVVLCDLLVSSALHGKGQPIYLVLCLSRLSVIIVGFAVAVRFGLGLWRCDSCVFRPWRRHRLSEDDRRIPLASNGASTGIAAADVSTPDSDMSLAGSVLSRSSRLDDELRQRREAEADREKNYQRRNFVLALCFTFITAQSIFAGIHVLSIVGADTFETSALVSTVVIMNAEFLLLKQLVDALTRDAGVLLKGIHEHPLHFGAEKRTAWCKLCRERIGPTTGGHEYFRCLECDRYFICLLCYRKQMTKENTEEGILRGDKGPKPPSELSAMQYFFRTIKLMRPFIGTLIAAVVCVIGGQVSQVLMPNHRGAVIDALINVDMPTFRQELTIFVALSVIASMLGSARGLTSVLVQRRVTFDTRTQMFQSLIKQDIAFFDGTSTGQLTSRMTNDVMTVVQPVNQILNQLMGAVIRFVGGAFMCLLTSWKLTVLVSTLIGPVIYLTRLYAQWSREVNTKIRAGMADANAVATEAMKNVRTVRAFAADQT